MQDEMSGALQLKGQITAYPAGIAGFLDKFLSEYFE
jgi:hypothetical protein